MNMVEVLVKVPAELAKEAKSKGYIEVAQRQVKARFKKFFKLPFEFTNSEDLAKDPMNALLKNGIQAVGSLNIAFQALNVVATIASTAIICNKLDRIRDQINELQNNIEDIKAKVEDLKGFNFETQIALPCREMLTEYKLISNKLEKRAPINEDALVNLIRKLNNYIITLFNLRDKCDLNLILDMIFSLLPIYTNCIMHYYERFYDMDQEKHPLHDDWMHIYDMLSNYAFIDQIQDYMFIEKHQTNKTVNEYLSCLRLIVAKSKQDINQLLEDLKACEGVDGYRDAVRWSRQYAAQQAKVIQAELETRYGVEKAKEMMASVIQEACA